MALPPAGEALALTVRRLLLQRATSDAELELAKDIDRGSAAALLYLADGEAHWIDEMAMHFDVAGRRVRMIVYFLTENGLAEVAHENFKDEAVKLTPAGGVLIVEISEMVAPQ